MTARDAFARTYADDLMGQYDCPDRLVFLAYNPYLQSGGGFRRFWRDLFGDDSRLTSEHIADLAGTMVRRLTAYCDGHGVPILDAAARERKGDSAEAYLPDDPGFTGLFLVQKSLAPAPVWHVERHPQKGYIIKLYRPKKWSTVRHVFFHIMDREWGHVTIRMCCHPPFGAMVIINGHDWVRRRAAESGLRVRTDGNCFIEGSDLKSIGALGERLAASAGDIQALAERWIYTACLCFGLSTQEQEQTAFRYAYSAFQLEYSRNYIFQRGRTLDQIYQSLVDRTRRALGLEQLKTILGYKRRPYTRPVIAIMRSCNAQGVYDLTTLVITWGAIQLKIYDKSGRLLRAEVTVHNAKALHCARSLQNIPSIMEQLRGILQRFMDQVQAVNTAFIGPDELQRWSQPGRAGRRRLAGINLNNARIRTVLSVLPLLSTAPDGFRSADLRDEVRRHDGQERYTIAQARYDLQKLHGKGLVRRLPHRRRYHVPPQSARKVCAYFTLTTDVIAPVLTACARHRRQSTPRGPQHPADALRFQLRDTLALLFTELGIAV
jgi:hypothetical protein